MTRRPHRTLAARLYALGLAQLAVLAVVASVLAFLLRPAPPPRAFPGHVLESARATLAPALDRPEVLVRQLHALAQRHDVDLSVYDEDGALLATTTEPPIELDRRVPPLRLGPGPRGPHGEPPPPPPPGPPPPDALGPPPPGGLGPPPPVFPVRLAHGALAAILMVRFHPRLPGWAGPLLTLCAGLVVIGLGALLTARWIARPLDRLAKTARAVGEGDLSARTGLTRTDELGAVALAFDEMAERIERLIRAERELLGNVSHELRTPLARIRVAMDLASEGDAEAARTALSEIATDLAELEAIVDDILLAMRLDVERARHDLLARDRTETSPRTLIQRAAELFQKRHPSRPLVLEVHEPLTPVLVDPVTFRRVLDNLLENAHKYSSEPDAPITLGARSEPGHTLFEIADRGTGIAAEDLPHVFEPFFRAERSRTRGAGGVGLGLTLAKRIVEAHGGRIAIASSVGSGTVVTVTLPRGAGTVPGAPR